MRTQRFKGQSPISDEVNPQSSRSKQKRNKGCLKKLAVVLGIVVLCVLAFGALLYPAVKASRRALQSNLASDYLKNVGLGIHQYASVNGAFPQAVTVDANGNPRNSWRISILQYLGDERRQQQWNADEAWDSSANSQLHLPVPMIYQSPFHSGEEGALTHIVAVRHPDGIMSGDLVSLTDVPDGLQNTVLAVMVPNRTVHWASPNDITLSEFQDEVSHASIENPVYVVLGDGGSEIITEPLHPSDVEAMVSRNGEDFYEFPH